MVSRLVQSYSLNRERNKMRVRRVAMSIVALIVLPYLISCSRDNSANPQPPLKTETRITKDDLKVRLAGKNVKFIEPEPDGIFRVDVFLLLLKLAPKGGAYQFILNNERLQNVDNLISRLQTIFKQREENSIIAKGVTLAASGEDIEFYGSNRIFLEDFESLVDDLKNAGIDQIAVDLAGLPMPDEILIERKLGNLKPGPVRSFGDVPPPPPMSDPPEPKLKSKP
jgi:hypothetical protein